MLIGKRAIYIGTTPMKRVGARGSTLYLGYGTTGEILFPGEGCHLFLTDDGHEWYVGVNDLYFPRA